MTFDDSMGLFIAIICGIILCSVVIYINLPHSENQTIITYNGTAPDDWVLPKGVSGIDYMLVAGGNGLTTTVINVGDGGWGIISTSTSNDATNVSEDSTSFRVPQDCKNPRISGFVIRNYKPRVGDIISYAECDNPNITYEEIMGEKGNTEWRKTDRLEVDTK